MLRILFLLSISCISISATLSTEELFIESGAPFTTTISLPEHTDAFQTYMEMLSIGRPLPWPYLLEGISLEKGKAILSGRVMESGTYAIPLGIFSYADTRYELPVLHVTANVPPLPKIDLHDLMPPFPESLIEPNTDNQKLQATVTAPLQQAILQATYQQDVLRGLFYVAILLCAISPFAWHLKKQMRSAKTPNTTVIVPTISMRLRIVQKSALEGKTAWTELLALLNCFGSKNGLTSFELAEQFAAIKKENLARAAKLVDKHAYRHGGEQQFFEAVHLVTKEV